MAFSISVGEPNPLISHYLRQSCPGPSDAVLLTLSLCVDIHHCCAYFCWHNVFLFLISEGFLTYSISAGSHTKLTYLLSGCVNTSLSWPFPFTVFWPVLVFREWVDSPNSHPVMEKPCSDLYICHLRMLVFFTDCLSISCKSDFYLTQWVQSSYILDPWFSN